MEAVNADHTPLMGRGKGKRDAGASRERIA